MKKAHSVNALGAAIDEEFKMEVAALACQPGTNWRWKRQYGLANFSDQSGGERKLDAAKAPLNPNSAAGEIRRLNSKIGSLETQVQILKKAIAIFSIGPQ